VVISKCDVLFDQMDSMKAWSTGDGTRLPLERVMPVVKRMLQLASSQSATSMSSEAYNARSHLTTFFTTAVRNSAEVKEYAHTVQMSSFEMVSEDDDMGAMDEEEGDM
jgi:hypothetical protein